MAAGGWGRGGGGVRDEMEDLQAAGVGKVGGVGVRAEGGVGVGLANVKPRQS